MLIGLHNYSYYMHGVGGQWRGFTPLWESQLDAFSLMDEAVRLGLDGLHIDNAALIQTDDTHLNKVKLAAEEKGLYLEYNWALPRGEGDPRLQKSLPEGIAIARKLKSDVGKISLNIDRPRPLTASRHHTAVVAQLEEIANSLNAVIPLLEETGVKIAVENHTDTYSTEILWLLDRLDHPLVGACIDTVNPLMVGEDPMVAIKNLVPRSFTNHFRDSRIDQTRYGCKIVGTALGKGDIDLEYAYKLICEHSTMNRINIEVALDAPLDDMDKALSMEREAVSRSVIYCREVLGM